MCTPVDDCGIWGRPNPTLNIYMLSRLNPKSLDYPARITDIKVPERVTNPKHLMTSQQRTTYPE